MLRRARYSGANSLRGGRRGGAGGWPSGPRWHCSPHSGRERCGSRSLSAWLGCGCLGLPATPHLRSCHVRETHLLHLCSASGMGDERPQTLSPYGSQTGKGLQPVHTHSEGPCTTISLCQRGRLGRRLWLSCSAYLSQTPGRGGGILFLGFLDGIPVQIQLSIIT